MGKRIPWAKGHPGATPTPSPAQPPARPLGPSRGHRPLEAFPDWALLPALGSPPRPGCLSGCQPLTECPLCQGFTRPMSRYSLVLFVQGHVTVLLLASPRACDLPVNVPKKETLGVWGLFLSALCRRCSGFPPSCRGRGGVSTAQVRAEAQGGALQSCLLGLLSPRRPWSWTEERARPPKD